MPEDVQQLDLDALYGLMGQPVMGFSHIVLAFAGKAKDRMDNDFDTGFPQLSDSLFKHRKGISPADERSGLFVDRLGPELPIPV